MPFFYGMIYRQTPIRGGLLMSKILDEINRYRRVKKTNNKGKKRPCKGY